MFSCEFRDISKNTVFHRTSLEAASADYVRPLKFFQLFFQFYWQLQSFMKTFVGYVFATFYEKVCESEINRHIFLMFRGSLREVFYQCGVLQNSAKFTLLKKRLWHRCILVNFAKYLRAAFFIEHLRWVILSQNLVKKLLVSNDQHDPLQRPSRNPASTSYDGALCKNRTPLGECFWSTYLVAFIWFASFYLNSYWWQISVFHKFHKASQFFFYEKKVRSFTLGNFNLQK